MFTAYPEAMPHSHDIVHVRVLDKVSDLPLDSWLKANVPDKSVRLVGLARTGTTTAASTTPLGLLASRYRTSTTPVSADVAQSHAVAEEEATVFSKIGEIRVLSGLTFEQLATLMGVQRRSIHNWMAGANVRAVHHERIGKVLALLRHADRGSGRANASMLLTPMLGTDTGLDLLSQSRFDEFKATAGKGPGRPEENKVDRSRTPIRGEHPDGWLKSVEMASSEEASGDAMIVPGRETRRVPFPKR